MGKRLCLHINNLGNTDERRGYRERLREHFRRFDSVLDETTRRRIDTNPLRILDSKDESARRRLQKRLVYPPHWEMILAATVSG